ncbi:MAG: hypothetical protein WCK27_11060 [Verrucomicrobiota bacterium]
MQDTKPKLGLAGGLGIALLAHLLTLTLRHAPRLLTVCLLLSLGYVAYLTLRTADSVRNPEKLAPVDLLLCRWCWVFILGPVTLFLTTAYSMEAHGLNPNVLIFGYDTGWLVFQLLMEAGLVFSVAAVFSPRAVAISRPRLVWKGLAVPMAVAHGFYVAGSLTRGFGQAL